LRIPQLRRHKSSNRAYVYVGGKQRYLGQWGSPEADQRYAAFLRDFLASPEDKPVIRKETAPLLWIELARRWTEEILARPYPSHDAARQAESMCRLSLDPVLDQFEGIPVAQFTPAKLLLVRDELVRSGRLCRKEINRRIRYVVRVLEWAVERELAVGVPIHDLQCVKPLRRGHPGIREPKAIRPVSDTQLEAVVTDLQERQQLQMACLLRFMAATGCRPGEAAMALQEDLRLDHPDGPVLVLQKHKTSRLTQEPRVIALNGPALEAISEAAADARVDVGHGEQPLFRSKRGDELGRFNRRAIEAAVKGSCQRCQIEPWSPNRLRHRFADRVAATLGLDATSAALGHSGDSSVARKHYVKDAAMQLARQAASAYEEKCRR
jgi:integrase